MPNVALPEKAEVQECSDEIQTEPDYKQREYIPIKKASYIEKYYLIKWLKYTLIEDNIFRSKHSFRVLCDTISLFDLNLDINKYCNETKSDFMDWSKDFTGVMFSWSNLVTDWLNELDNVKLEKDNDILIKKFQWLKSLYELSDLAIEFITYIYFRTKHVLVFKNLFEAISYKDSDMKFWYCLIEDGRADDQYELIRKLFEKGITTYNGGKAELNNLSYTLLKVLDDKTLTTSNKFFRALLDKNITSQLCLKDFNYVKSDKVINILKQSSKQKTKGINILLYGAVGTGKTEFSKVICKEAGLKLYPVKTELEDYKEAKREDRLTDLYSKQILLEKTNNTAILFDEAEDVLNRGFCENGTSSKGYMNRLLENTKVPVIWTTNNIYDVDPAFLRRMTYCIKFEKLNEEQRLHVWNNILKKQKMKLGKETLNKLNEEYDVYPSIISNAVKTVKMIDGGDEDFSDIIESVASVVSKKNEVKNKKDNKLEDYDLSLINTNTNIPNLTDKIKECGKLNFSLCLYGEPGTGKSLYARYLANQLGLEVIQKRASDLISSWVGETEQNIAAAFSEAKSKKAMLIFDEADSFLQNRNNAIRSWEVTQVNEMLTQMESYEYPFVCTTNLMDSLDEASLRRFTFKVAFNFMTKEQVKKGLKHFFNIDTDVFIKGLTPGDFATVKKRTEFLNIKDEQEIYKMLQEEVKVKKSKTLQNTIGF